MTERLASAPGDGLAARNRLPMRAVQRGPGVLLDGVWEFQLATGWGAELADRWERVDVPSLWTMSSSVDRPHYTNVPMPFDDVPPVVPARNPVGVYRRTVHVDPAPGRRLVLHVGAAEGHLRVAVNGEFVGSSTDSHLEAGFDVTTAMRPGENLIELAVAKWSAASYLEDQDQWWQSGLSRSVRLLDLPAIAISDVVLDADWDPATRRGALVATVTSDSLAGLAEHGYTARVRVADRDDAAAIGAKVAAPTLPKPGKVRAERPQQRLPDDFMDLMSISAAQAPLPPEFRANPEFAGLGSMPVVLPAGRAVVRFADLDVPAWSAERPHLETVTVTLIDGTGEPVDEVDLRVGFRRVAVVGPDLLINGERVLIQGVNRHDFDPVTGRVMTPDRMLAELSLLKRCNVNAIRAAHYPNDPHLLDLCDRLGVYVLDEADVEGHAFASTIADDPRYLAPIIERVSRMVARDRNHPSVIMWSLGNETGYGSAHDAAAAWVRRVDPTRPVHYEGAIATDWHGGHAATDVVGAMYPSFAALEAYSADPRADRPLISCEYLYAQGNGSGGADAYWELFETRPKLQGGFVWEFVDHALDPDHDGRGRYGGDFGDEPNNGVVLLNGIVFPDLTAKPALLELRGLFGPVRIVSDADALLRGRLRIRSRRYFENLSDLRATLVVQLRSGAGIERPVELQALRPGAELSLELDEEVLAAVRDPSALGATLVVATARDLPWAPAGTELDRQQVRLPRVVEALPVGAAAEVDDTGTVRHPLLAAGPRLSLWRALTDDDLSFALDQRFVRSGFFRLDATAVDVEQTDDASHVRIDYRTAFGDEVQHRRRIERVADGDWVFHETVELPEGTKDGLRVGIDLTLVDGFEQAAFVGLGPWENYPDRAHSAELGRWTSDIDDLAVPYLRPQENGSRGGVDRLELWGDPGELVATSSVPLHVSASRHTVDQLEAATHWWRLPASQATVVHLDVAMRGVGTALLGPDTRPVHRLSGRRWSWSWRLRLAAAER